MKEILEIIFRSFWTFTGTFLLVYITLYGIIRTLYTIKLNNLFKVRKEREMLAASLTELVKLKQHKDTIGKDTTYERLQPIAWDKAKEVLKRCNIYG